MTQQYQVYFDGDFSFLVDAADLDDAVEQTLRSNWVANDDESETCRVQWSGASQVHARLELRGGKWVEVSRQEHT